MQTAHFSFTLLEFVIYNDSLPLVSHLEIGDKSNDKLPTMVSKWRALYPRAPWSLLSWHCITADPARLSIDDRSWRRVQHPNKLPSTLCLNALKGEGAKKAAAFRRCFRNKRRISPGWGGAAGAARPVPNTRVMWGQELLFGASALVGTQHWLEPAAPTYPASLGTGTGTAKPLPQKRTIFWCLQLSIQRSSFLHCWLAKLSEDPLSHISWEVPVPHPGQGFWGGLSHTPY